MAYVLLALVIAALAVLLVRHIRDSRKDGYDYDGELPRNPRQDGGPRNPLP